MKGVPYVYPPGVTKRPAEVLQARATLRVPHHASQAREGRQRSCVWW